MVNSNGSSKQVFSTPNCTAVKGPLQPSFRAYAHRDKAQFVAFEKHTHGPPHRICRGLRPINTDQHSVRRHIKQSELKLLCVLSCARAVGCSFVQGHNANLGSVPCAHV